MKIWKIAQNNITIDLSKFVESARDRIDGYIDFDREEHRRLLQYQFNPEWILKTLNDVGYPNVNLVSQFFQTKDMDQLHTVLMDIFSWWKKIRDQKGVDIRMWDKISPAVKALNDYESVLSGNQITWTEEYGAQQLQEMTVKTQTNMEKIRDNISKALSRIPQWNGSAINIVASELYKDNALEPETNALIEIGQGESWGGIANFSYFVSGENIELDDILEGGDTDFFTDNNVQSDYFNLINSLRNPNAFSNPKVLTLYTARPTRDRQIYTEAKEIPSNIFLTNKYDFAEGFAIDSGERDIWKIKILDRYLVKTMDFPDQKQYQTTGTKTVPVVSTELITPWMEK